MSAPDTPCIKAWQCIGCGRLEAQATCLGICEDRPVRLVHAHEYEEAQARAEALASVVREIACITPREGAWESSYRALQARARKLLAMAEKRPKRPG